MAKCFIHGLHVIGTPLSSNKVCKQANLKIYRDKDEAELSISFDNSLGAFSEELRRIVAEVINHFVNE